MSHFVASVPDLELFTYQARGNFSSAQLRYHHFPLAGTQLANLVAFHKNSADSFFLSTASERPQS